jgi:hypothetical protein
VRRKDPEGVLTKRHDYSLLRLIILRYMGFSRPNGTITQAAGPTPGAPSTCMSTARDKTPVLNGRIRGDKVAAARRAHYCLLLLVSAAPAFPAPPVLYAGAIGGIATLSAEAGSQNTSEGLSLSAYSPSNGSAVNAFAGLHLHDYFSIQANSVRNPNDVVINSTSSASNMFYEQARTSSQKAVILDFLVYFRPRSSRLRPYLGTGGGVSHLSSQEQRRIRSGGAPALSPSSFSSTRPVFRSHVGIDLRLSTLLDFRYSFSETIGGNAISKQLSPPAPRRLANFQNLFGFAIRF